MYRRQENIAVIPRVPSTISPVLRARHVRLDRVHRVVLVVRYHAFQQVNIHCANLAVRVDHADLVGHVDLVGPADHVGLVGLVDLVDHVVPVDLADLAVCHLIAGHVA